MIHSDNSRPYSSRRMPFCIAVLAVLFVPLGIAPLESAIGQDIEAVQRRLIKSVKKHELTLEQAAVMMHALKEFMEEEHEHKEEHEHDHWQGEEKEIESRRAEEYYRAEHELMRAVKNGRISEEDAKRRLMEHKKHLWGKGDDSEKDERSEFKRKYREAEGRLAKMVEAGKISEEAAEERLESMKEYWSKREHRKPSDQTEFEKQMERVERRVKAGVESGRMTEEEARTTYEKYKRRFMQEARDKEEGAEHEGDEDQDVDDRAEKARERLENIGRRIRLAVQAGDMTPEEARATYIELRRELESRDKDGGDHNDHDHDAHDHDHDHDHDHAEHNHDDHDHEDHDHDQ